MILNWAIFSQIEWRTLYFLPTVQISSGTFVNRNYEQLSYPKNLKMCNPILVTLLNMQTPL